jgi:hypothetical protein
MFSGKNIAVFVFLMILVAVGYAYWRKYRQAQKLSFGVDGIKPNVSSVADVSKILLTGANIPVTLKPVINNYSPSTFKIQQLKLDIYSEDGKNLLGSQNLPLNSTALVQPNSKTVLSLNYSFNPVAFFNSAGRKLGISELVDWYTGKSIGIKLKLSGFVVAEGIKVNLDQVITI